MSGCEKPIATLSKTEQESLGQNNLSLGRGALNSISVFNVGSDPGYLGSVFKFSKLVKYNILFIFTLLMVQGLVISYWDLLFNPEMNMKDLAQLGIDADQGITLEDSSRTVAMGLFAMIFFSFLGIYLYCYGQSLQGVFPTLPGCSWLTDSVCFWIRILGFLPDHLTWCLGRRVCGGLMIQAVVLQLWRFICFVCVQGSTRVYG